MKADIYSEKGIKLTTKADLPDEIFAIKPNDAVIRQYVRVYQVNQRLGTVSTKTRAEISGGGRKPWAQKGTGRARHGSTRSPIWVGGGITFGPRPRSFELSIPKKVRDLALKSVLSWKSKSEKIFVVEEFSPKEPKTKIAANLLEKLGLEKTLVITAGRNSAALRSFRNIPGVSIREAASVNPYDVLSAKRVVILKDAISVLSKRLGIEAKISEPAKKPAVKKAAAKPAKKTVKPPSEVKKPAAKKAAVKRSVKK